LSGAPFGARDMQFGIWLPVYGGWLRTQDQPTGPDVAACLAIAQQAEALGFDFLYASENLLNCIHGPSEGVADAWSLLAAIAATTSRVGLCGAIKPGFRSPFLVARMLDTLAKVAERRLSMNIVCGWWKEEFELSNVDWLDHDGRYDRAANFVRTLHGLFRPPLDMSQGDLSAQDTIARFPERAGGPGPTAPNYGLDESALPDIWIAGQSRRAIQMAAEWGNCLYVNGMQDRDLAGYIAAVRQESNRWGRSISIAVNAYVIATEQPAEAMQRWNHVLARRNSETIAFFRSVMDESGAAAWSKLTDEQMVDSNAGFELGLIGSFDEIRDRIPTLKTLGVDRIVCQFDDPMRDAGPFMMRVIRPLQTKEPLAASR
jgi:FMNH2-dependent dimethyl sulfone monooxygenase